MFYQSAIPFSTRSVLPRQRTQFQGIGNRAISLDLEMTRGSVPNCTFQFPIEIIGGALDVPVGVEPAREEPKNMDGVGTECLIIAPALLRHDEFAGEGFDQPPRKIAGSEVSCAEPPPMGEASLPEKESPEPQEPDVIGPL